MRTCALCGKKLKGIFKHEHFGREFCTDCYGYVVLFCHSPEDVGKHSIEELKAMHNKNTCDLCGKRVPAVQKKFLSDGTICRDCEALLRPYFDNLSDRKAALLLNALDAVVSAATDTPGTAYQAEDLMERAGIERLKALYMEVTGVQ